MSFIITPQFRDKYVCHYFSLFLFQKIIDLKAIIYEYRMYHKRKGACVESLAWGEIYHMQEYHKWKVIDPFQITLDFIIDFIWTFDKTTFMIY